MNPFDKHLPKPVSLNTLPLLSLRETYNESSFQVFDGQEYIPTQDIFRPEESPQYLSGTITGGCEPFALRLRGVNCLPRNGIVCMDAPVDHVTLPILAVNPPTWLALTNFREGDDKHTICYFPSEHRPLMTFQDIHRIGCNRTDEHDMEQLLEDLLVSGFHILVIDFTRRKTPGTHVFDTASDFWRHRNTGESSPLDIFKIAA